MSSDSLDASAPEQDAAALDELLGNRFSALWMRSMRAGISAEPAPVYSVLRAHYSEGHRHYHDGHHVAQCLDQLDLAGPRVEHRDDVELAIWFHDVINLPGNPCNEAESAELFGNLARGVLADDQVDAVVRLILVTTHRDAPRDADEQYLCDIDLASFGCPWDCYMKDTRNLQAEFPGSEADYYRRQRPFLEGLLHRPRIFFTDFFHGLYEQRARENIRRLLDIVDGRRDA